MKRAILFSFALWGLFGCCSCDPKPLAASYERYIKEVGGELHKRLKADKLDAEDQALEAREAAAAALIARARRAK